MEDKKTKKSKKIEEVLEPTKQTNNDTMEEKPKKSRVKKTEAKEVSEVEEKPKKSRAKKTEDKDVSEVEEKPKKSRAKKTEVKEEVSEVEEKPKKSRAKKTEVKEEVSEIEEKPKKSRAKKTEVKEEVSEIEEEQPTNPEPKKSRTKKPEVKEVSEVEYTSVKVKQSTEIKDCYIQQSEIDCLLSFSQKCKTSIVSYYDTIIDNISKMQKDVKSIDTIRSSTNDIYKNMFDILSNNNLLINHIHNLHTNFVIAANSKLTKEQYLEITKECCVNIDKLRDTYINNADQHNESLTKLYVQLNEFLESLQNSNIKLEKNVKSVINSDSENSDTGSDKLDMKVSSKPTKSLKLEKSIIKSESDSDSE